MAIIRCQSRILSRHFFVNLSECHISRYRISMIYRFFFLFAPTASRKNSFPYEVKSDRRRCVSCHESCAFGNSIFCKFVSKYETSFCLANVSSNKTYSCNIFSSFKIRLKISAKDIFNLHLYIYGQNQQNTSSKIKVLSYDKNK